MTTEPAEGREAELQAFWEVARVRANLNRLAVYTGPTPLDILRPPDWSFGSGPEMADQLIELVLDGTKTATASALVDYEAAGEEVPRAGDLSIVTDGAGHPRALIVTTEVQVVPFGQVSAAHAEAEGEGDRSLDFWRTVHERYFTETSADLTEPMEELPVVCERFRVLYP